MRPILVTMNAAGYSQWIPIDYIESWFGTTVGVILSEDGNLTYTVEFTLDGWDSSGTQTADNAVTISRTTTVATVTDKGPNGIGHGLTTGDNVIIRNSGAVGLDSPVSPLFGNGDKGWQIASTPSTTTYTYTVANSGATADNGNASVQRLRVFTHATLSAQTTRQNGTLNYPVRGVRLHVSTYAAGFADMIILQGMPA